MRMLVGIALAVFAASSASASPPAGSLNPAVTQANIDQTICAHGYTKSIRPSVSFTNRLKRALMAQEHRRGSINAYELDHFIPLELGGAPRDPANLWLELWPEARRKDVDETALHRAVCHHTMTLAVAQASIRKRWGAQ